MLIFAETAVVRMFSTIGTIVCISDCMTVLVIITVYIVEDEVRVYW